MRKHGPGRWSVAKIQGVFHRVRRLLPGRLAAPLWGTTTLGDCQAVLGYLADRNHLVAGPAIAEYETAFAKAVGSEFGISFSTGRRAGDVLQFSALWVLALATKCWCKRLPTWSFPTL